MKIDDKIKDGKLQYDINREHNHLKKLVNMNILHVKKYYFLIKEE